MAEGWTLSSPRKLRDDLVWAFFLFFFFSFFFFLCLSFLVADLRCLLRERDYARLLLDDLEVAIFFFSTAHFPFFFRKLPVRKDCSQTVENHR